MPRPQSRAQAYARMQFGMGGMGGMGTMGLRRGLRKDGTERVKWTEDMVKDSQWKECLVRSSEREEEIQRRCTLLRPIGPLAGWDTAQLRKVLTGPDAKPDDRVVLSEIIADLSFGRKWLDGHWYHRERPVFIRVSLENLTPLSEGVQMEMDVDLVISATWREEAMVGADPSQWDDDDAWGNMWDPLDDAVLKQEDGTPASYLSRIPIQEGEAEWRLVDPDEGVVTHKGRWKGVAKNLLVYLAFPFDCDTFGISYASVSRAVRLYWDLKFHPGWVSIPPLAEWVIGRAELIEPRTENENSLTLKISLQRSPTFYLYNILLVVLLLMCLSWSLFVFRISDEGFGAVDLRMNLALALFLSLVAFQ